MYEALKLIWSKALFETRANVLALTVPESGWSRDAISMRQKALNELILSHREDRFYTADVCAAMPWPEDVVEQARIWDDGLHFTRIGYGVLGDVVADRLLGIIDSNALVAEL